MLENRAVWISEHNHSFSFLKGTVSYDFGNQPEANEINQKFPQKGLRSFTIRPDPAPGLERRRGTCAPRPIPRSSFPGVARPPPPPPRLLALGRPVTGGEKYWFFVYIQSG